MSKKKKSYLNSKNMTTTILNRDRWWVPNEEDGKNSNNDRVNEIVEELKSLPLKDVLWDEMDLMDDLITLATEAPSGKEILNAGIDIISLLLKKNISYGNSAIDPLRLFSNASTEEQIYVRLDDKLSRLKNNQSFPGDNDIDDLIGYLILLKVARRINA